MVGHHRTAIVRAGKNRCTHGIGGGLGPRAVLNVLEQRITHFTELLLGIFSDRRLLKILYVRTEDTDTQVRQTGS